MSSLHARFSSVYKNKRVWLSGHTGFKGAWLAEWLLQLGAEVHGYALEPSTTPSLFDDLDLAARLYHQVGDIRNFSLVRESILSYQPDFIFHLAAQPLVRYSYREPLETYETNVMGTLHVLEAMREFQNQSLKSTDARNNGVASVLTPSNRNDTLSSCESSASSTSVSSALKTASTKKSSRCIVGVMVTTDKCYENNEDQKAYYEEHPLGGHDPYSSSKAMAEIGVSAYRRSYFSNASSVHVATARAGNVIGGGDWAHDRIVPDAIRALEKKEPIFVRNPFSVRPWQHVLEPLSGYLMLGAQLTKNHEIAGAFNFGPHAEENYSVVHVVSEVLKHWPGSWKGLSDPMAPHEAHHLNLSIKKAVEVLGWYPVWNFEKTIERTVQWYRAYHGDPKSALATTRDQIATYEADAKLARMNYKEHKFF